MGTWLQYGVSDLSLVAVCQDMIIGKYIFLTIFFDKAAKRPCRDIPVTDAYTTSLLNPPRLQTVVRSSRTERKRLVEYLIEGD